MKSSVCAAVACLVSSLAFAASPALAGEPAIAKGERQLVVVADLSTHAPQYPWLYKFIEANAVGMAQAKLGTSYAKIKVLSLENATLENFHSGLAALASDPGTKKLDVFLSLHGSPGALWFHEGPHGSAEVRQALQTHAELTGKLRLLYSTACYGDSHAEDFLAAGFQVASGSKGVNANSEYEYPTMMDSWKAGNTYAAALTAGDNPIYRRIWDNIAKSQMGDADADSTKVLHGEGSVTIGAVAQ